ncbi:MAG: hypothetical protein DYG94_05805 [Leptolyngbya sp. PLA3]|nr:MAG: hypothetical protein EDM82_04315 [Cyanobacteria bacterium CYA]MCE7968246.1 hypothetical protein [Leptolyngbya sp. PL-A3]
MWWVTLTSDKQQAVSQALALTLVVAGLLVAVVVGLVAYSLLRRRRERFVSPVREPSKHLDAWSAAAERVQYERRADEFEDDDETDVDDSTWYEDSDESSWDEDDEEDDNLSQDDPPSGPRPPRPTSGPLPPEDPGDDDSFNDDDIPGSRLDWKPKDS